MIQVLLLTTKKQVQNKLFLPADHNSNAIYVQIRKECNKFLKKI